MTNPDSDELFDLPEGAEIIKGVKLFMNPVFRAITCPNGELVFLRSQDIEGAYQDLQTWALPISNRVLNQ